jgi:hypothetical protein
MGFLTFTEVVVVLAFQVVPHANLSKPTQTSGSRSSRHQSPLERPRGAVTSSKTGKDLGENPVRSRLPVQTIPLPKKSSWWGTPSLGQWWKLSDVVPNHPNAGKGLSFESKQQPIVLAPWKDPSSTPDDAIGMENAWKSFSVSGPRKRRGSHHKKVTTHSKNIRFDHKNDEVAQTRAKLLEDPFQRDTKPSGRL